MIPITHVNVALPLRIAQALQNAVDSGEYSSTDEAICDALRMWEARVEIHPEGIEKMRRIWDAGKASGIAGPLDIPRLMAEARAKMVGIGSKCD